MATSSKWVRVLDQNAITEIVMDYTVLRHSEQCLIHSPQTAFISQIYPA